MCGSKCFYFSNSPILNQLIARRASSYYRSTMRGGYYATSGYITCTRYGQGYRHYGRDMYCSTYPTL